MISPPTSPPPTPHPFLAPGRASSITSWATSLPERSSRPSTASEIDGMSRDAAFEAYRQLKLALFSKVWNTQLSKPVRPES
ncbi:hypothetical protein K505DRAFT_256327 [Melanomma pulvis-pyrius CBS 109.77]|uniref:Uncharacterized protein n=1 Tax=Melanomma pulvis-pyrius CBS 109.77 TaxID=1314802 RepID=A0A6A6WWF9_9PLEO|nr:hypothetical protein K505DRAFT_256327 [Melanomma pulvis-pyrius CBS 109.77]